MSQTKEVEIIQADKMLQSKVGTGKIDDAAIEKCQEVMDNNNVDFAPVAIEFLDKLQEAIEYAKSNDHEMTKAVKMMTTPVMQLKANAATFHYNLVGNLANVMLSFLEALKVLDDDAITIVGAHHKTLHAIALKKMKGDGGAYGVQLEQELKDVCKRYYASRKNSK